MAEVEYTTTAELPVEVIWEFVKEMDNWARFVTGYQGHEKQSETDSVWTLKGDVGVLARRLRFRVQVTEWAGPERVAFALTGLNEPMQGSGSFLLERSGSEAPPPAATPRGLLARLVEALFRLLFRLRHGRTARPDAATVAGPGARLTFRLRIDPGGPMAPMVNAMMRPAMLPAAESLANRIMAHLEARDREEEGA